MDTTAPRPLAGTPTPRPLALWSGRALTALPILLLLFSAGLKLSGSPQALAQLSGRLGWPAGSLAALALLELACVLLYAIPRTAVLGAVLLTGYLGAAAAAHLRVADAFVAPLVLGVLVWAGVYLRDERLRALLPLRREQGPRAAPAGLRAP